MDWKDIPSLAALRAFECAARSGSFTGAARELNVTHAAIAQHVRAIETELGTSLLVREGRGLALTETGQRLAQSLSDGFGQIAAGVQAARADIELRPLSVTVTHNFAENWLMRRISAFWAEHPQIALSIVPSNRLIDLRRDSFDIGVRYGDGNWPGLEATPLVAADYTVVAAPGVVRADQISKADVPWYFEENHAEAQRWAMATGMIAHDRNIHSVATLGMALSAVRSGSGVTVTSSALVADDIKAGRLMALRQTHPEKMGYYIIHYPGVMSERAKTFKSWLLKAI
ncbi:LysR family transcriptional regulator [Loktanella sp. S4079]|uniref:LysR family transcriptional regulator n=1 Tax=Loktanella sp. S4079 TaxID=579483 RepID=UPI0005FA10D0|nr:LysR family transcriptional regulator [Loktanella sp. S4079]KJZ19438.1 hypothetical protein TW80_11825 [Loktanella sp. S4079]